MAPTPSVAAATEQAAVAALRRIHSGGHAQLAQNFLNDLIAAGFNSSAAVRMDIAKIMAVDPAAGMALTKLMADPQAMALFFADGTGLAQIGASIGGAASGIANSPGDLNIGKGIVGGLHDTVAPAIDVAGFLSALVQRNTWVRIGEGVLGLILIGIGIAAVTRSQPLGKAAIKAAGKAAVL